jgi:hypothetical protein
MQMEHEAPLRHRPVGWAMLRIHLAPDPLQPDRESPREPAPAEAVVECGVV